MNVGVPKETAQRERRVSQNPDVVGSLDEKGIEVALEAGLAGGTEAARHRAAGLGRHAHGRAVGVVHQHRLDERAVVQAPQPLDRVPVVAHRLGGLLQRRREGGLEAFAARTTRDASTPPRWGERIVRFARRNGILSPVRIAGQPR